MTCFECGGEIIRKMTSFIMYDTDHKPVLFEDVEAGECTQCGEKYLDGHTVEKIEKILEGGASGSTREIKVPVISLAA
ncbi:MAG: hypothetical protein FD174_417 [Geobacteraceae bacterium]|nr:MAG: hypothetical protein FD174_417 [Geobacteraceae bacterium]